MRLIQEMRDLTVIEDIILEGQRKRREIRNFQRRRSIRNTREVDLTQKINVGHLNLKGVLFKQTVLNIFIIGMKRRKETRLK